MTAETLFREFFLPLYPEEARRDLGRARTEDRNPAGNPNILAQLDDAARTFASVAPLALGVPEAELGLDFSDASVHRLSRALTPERRERLAGEGARGTAESAFFNFVVHGAAYVGACIVRGHGGAWRVRQPLWESLVQLTSRAGEAELPVFHWLLKSIAATEGATLADRYRAHVEVPTARPEDLPVLTADERKFPKLGKVRYDVLYKYIKAHIPELKDVGKDFPSPERIEDLKLASLSFMLVGGGRMLVMAGPNKDGLHAFWLTKAGFEKAAFWPCDSFPAPMMRPVPPSAEGELEKLEVLLSREGKPLSFELLWWGP